MAYRSHNVGRPQEDTYRAALLRAAEIHGGVGPLAKQLRAPAAYVARWLDGQDAMPGTIFLRVVDMLIEGTKRPDATATSRGLGSP